MSDVQRDVGRMLRSYSRRTLETWAQARGLEPKRLRGPELQAQLARVLLSPTALKAALAMTNADEQLALGRLKLEGGKVPAAELKPQLAVDGVRDPEAVLTSLMAGGLIFYDRAMEGYGQWEIVGQNAKTNTWQQYYLPALWLPSEVAELVTIPEELGKLPLEAAPAPVEVRERSFAALQRDLYLILQAMRENPVKLLKSGGIGKRESERLLTILPRTGGGENDPTARARAEGAWFRFLWTLIQRAGLLQEQEGRLVVTPLGAQFLGQSEAQQAAELLKGWLSLVEWNEFLRVPSLELDHGGSAGFTSDDLAELAMVYGGVGDVPSPPQLLMARETLIELLRLRHAYPGWFSLASVAASMQRLKVGFLIPRHSPLSYMPWGAAAKPDDRQYRGFHARGSSPPRHFNKDKDWDQVEGAYLRTVFEEPLLWLGIVRLGYEKGELVSFELTERGAVAVGLLDASKSPTASASPAATGQRALVVQPNFEVVVYPEVAGISLLVELDRFAERVRVDRAALYRLTRADLCRGLISGLTLAEITHTLETHNAAPLPQNVAYSLAEWEQLYNRIHVQRGVSLIEAADDAELRALRVLPELKNAREIAPRLLLVPPGATARTLRLKPEVIDYAAPITHALEFETATRLRVVQPSPRLLHRLRQIADPVDANHRGGTETRRTAEKKGSKGSTERVASAASSSPSGSVSPCLRSESESFELSREKVGQVARWWKWEAVRAFLAGAARAAPPAELEVILKGWAGELAPAAVTSLTLLAAPSAEWLDQVMLIPAVLRFILHRLSPTLALVAQENRQPLEEALAAAGIAAGAALSLQDLLTAEARAANEAGDILLVGPPRKRRALIQQAVAARKRLVIGQTPYGGKIVQTKLDPVRIDGEGAGAMLVARVEGLRYEQHYSLNQIQGVRMLDEPVKP